MQASFNPIKSKYYNHIKSLAYKIKEIKQYEHHWARPAQA
jgi:hypothetical protein